MGRKRKACGNHTYKDMRHLKTFASKYAKRIDDERKLLKYLSFRSIPQVEEVEDYDDPDNVDALASLVFEFDHATKEQRNEWDTIGARFWKLTEDIVIENGENALSWNLWKYDPGKLEYGYHKVVPKYVDKDTIKAVIKAQRWLWI